MKFIPGMVIIGIGAVLLAGCNLNLTQPNTATGKDPVIQSFTANPSAGGNWDQAYTFQVSVYDPGDNVLKYTWNSTAGVLSSITGQVTQWQPPHKAGVYTISCNVIDSVTGGQAVGQTNVTIDGSGSVSIQQ